MTADDWGVIVALVAVLVGAWFSWRSLKVSIFNQTDAAMLSMKAQLSETTTALVANLRSIAHTIRMTRNAPYTFTSVVETTDVDGNTESREYPGLLWITFEGGDSASIEAKRVTLYAFSQAYERTLAAGSQVEFAAAQYRALAERGRGSSAEFLSRHRDTLASFAAVLGRLLEGSLHWTPNAEDISELGDAGLGVPDPDATGLLAAFRIVIPVPSDLASSDIRTRHRWARTRLVDSFDELASDALRQTAEALALRPR
jgi:multidrug efflux pump subunit AcrB